MALFTAAWESGRARGRRPYDDMSLMVLFAERLKRMDNMNNNDNKDGFVGGFIRGFCIVFFGGLIVLGIVIILLLAL